jgi:hypothetical protein
MKKVFVLFAGVSLLTFTSCGGATTVCDCAEALKEMSKDYEEAMGDEKKMEKLETKYEKISQDCEALAKEMGQEEFQKSFADCN